MGRGIGRQAERRGLVGRQAPLTRRRRTTCSTSQSRWCVFVPKSSILEYPMREYPEYPMTAPADVPSNRYSRRAMMAGTPVQMPPNVWDANARPCEYSGVPPREYSGVPPCECSGIPMREYS